MIKSEPITSLAHNAARTGRGVITTQEQHARNCGFAQTARYPESPGQKGGMSSGMAAELKSKSAEVTREQALSLLLCHDYNADTLALVLRKDVRDLRSRCSELAAAGCIRFSGKCSDENNPNGIRTKVWTTR